ncbi:MAG: HD domain-containing protein [Ruminococcaceae bacterium]|nr:HD domain-containing protein [Oscillospiraceae bacterium]
MTIEQMREKLEEILTPKRYEHSIGVMETAAKMAEHYGVDVEKAKIAGLLHDCAKDIDKDLMVGLCDELGIELDDVKREQRSLIHADLGAGLLTPEFEVTDPEIISAVKHHTLGRENMTDLEKILYLADIIEPNRKPYPELEELRRLSMSDLDCAMLCACEHSIAHVERKHKTLHSQTLATQQYFLTLCKERITR